MTRAPDEEPLADYLARVRAYYSRELRAYLDDLGPTWQGGLLAQSEEQARAADEIGPPLDAAASNRLLARRAGLRAGMHVLDAGCGVCGPASDMASAYAGLTLDAVTLGLDQAREARRRVAAAGLDARVRVLAADFHALPFGAARFERVLYLESNGYMHALARALGEAWRVLRPGGEIYVKGVFRAAGPLSREAQRQFDVFDGLYAHRSRPLDEFLQALSTAGFEDVRAQELNALVSSAHYFRAMFVAGGGLTRFGRAHHRDELSLTPVYAEVRARRP
jgi:ubiquinone/menaquinone biosynthesis C-methylase UbiE